MTAVLSLEDVTKRFGETVAVDGLSLEVHDGELLTLVGPSGCGKSTLLRLIAGLLVPDSGTIAIHGEAVAGAGAWRAPEQRRVGIVFQEHALFPHLTVAENVAFGLGPRALRRDRDRIEEVLALVDMRGFAERYPHELSGGEQQRIALARSLAPRPQVVLLDEPFSDLDRELRLQVRAHTIAVLREVGATTVFVTHDQEESLAVGDRVVVMRAGRLEQDDVPAQVFHAPTNRFVATFMGDADFLPARRVGDELVTEVGACPAPSETTGRGELEVMVRPHEMQLRRDPDGGGTVVATVFQGAFVLYRVQLRSGQVVRSLRPHTEVFPPGATVEVTMAHGHAPTVFAGDRAVAAGHHAAVPAVPVSSSGPLPPPGP